MGNQQVTKALSKLVGTSETIRPLTINNSDNSWNQWLAGLIDSDGSLLISSKGYISCEITMDLKDEHALLQVKNKLGGSVKLRSGSKSIRYRLHHKKGILDLINRINGEIRNSVRIEQLKKICNHLNITFINPTVITLNNSWFSGFFDGDGTITFSMKNDRPQLTISVSNKKKIDLIFYLIIFQGNIYFDKSGHGSYKWSIQSKQDILFFLEYIKLNPLRSSKKYRFYLIPIYYELISLKAYIKNDSLNYKAWLKFIDKWFTRTEF